jgi:tRNA (guanine37-N1)-methyltransferase
MKFIILTLFPKIFDSYLEESILKRARENKKISIETIDVRKFTSDKHHTADDKPYGGGAGMVLLAEPILKAVESVKSKVKSNKRKVVVFSAKGKQFNQKNAYDWARKYDELIFIAGRYEGIDERVVKALKAEEISIGPYVLTDGDVAAMVVMSAVARLVPGVIRLESLAEESHWNLILKQEARKTLGAHGLEYPHYTRPEVLKYKGKRYSVPKILLSGNHAMIKKWREGHKKNV